VNILVIETATRIIF